jgi:SAM-dependent methyltransferase
LFTKILYTTDQASTKHRTYSARTRDSANEAMSEVLPNDQRSRLRAQFDDLPIEQHAAGWDKLWSENFTPWDRDKPSPALVDTLNDKTSILGSPVRGKPGEPNSPQPPPRKRVLVPGCGKGYDVLLFSSYGYDAYGLDVSQLAVNRATALSSEPSLSSKYPSGVSGRGEIKFLLADFFKDDFLSQTGGGTFDVIYDYTFLVALPPSMRPAWAKRMSELLSPIGHLICLEFPLHKEPQTGGPPHGVTAGLYEQLLDHPGRDVTYDPKGYVVENHSPDKGEGTLVRIDRWLAERTHEAGMGRDHVSIWRHR